MGIIEDLSSEYNKILESQLFDENDLDYSVLDNHIMYLDWISQVSNSVIMIFDLFKKNHVYISKNFSKILGLDYEKAHEDINYLNYRVHPDDLIDLYYAGIYFLKYGMSLSVDQKKEGKLVNEYRIKNGEGIYIRIIEQQICLELDKNGNIWLALGIIDLSPDQSENQPFRSRLINLRSGEIYMFPPMGKENNLTMREKEILKLIAEGLLSKEIADKLNISVNTVNTYRQKILEKLQVDNSIEAVNYARQLGII